MKNESKEREKQFMSTQHESIDVLFNEQTKHVMKGKNIKQENPEAKMAKENTDLDNESTTVKEVDIEKYINSKLKSVFDDDGKDTIEIRQITLRMAKMWNDKGHIYEAIDLYKKLFKQHAGTSEAKEAKEALTRFAKKFESEGRHHQAHALYNEIFI